MSAFADVRVLDLSCGIAGSWAAGLIADFGADVVKIETLARKATPDLMFGDRSKLTLQLDATDAGHRKVVGDLFAQCDVYITDDPRLADSFEVDERHQIPSRIMAKLPRYAGAGDNWGDESAGLLHATTGFAAFQTSYSGAPVDVVYPYILICHAVWAATCITAALVERERSGQGQLIEVSGAHAANVFNAMLYTRQHSDADPNRAIGPGGLSPLYTIYRAGEGQYFFLGALGPKFGLRALEATDLLDLLDDPRIAGKLAALWSAKNADWVRARFQQLFETAPVSHWIELFESLDIPCTVLGDRTDWLRHPQIRAIGMCIERDHPDHGRVVMPGVPIHASATPATVRVLDDVTRGSARAAAINGTLWPIRPATTKTFDKLPACSGPLAGIRILSMGSFVAGPYAAALLAELGAQVVKVEPPEGDPWREIGFCYNLGVESLAVDMRTEKGRDVLAALIPDTDIIVNNFRLGVMEKLGLDFERLAGLNPEIVDVAVTAYGEVGNLKNRPGYDSVLAAASGIMRAQGGGDEPVSAAVPVVDYTTAVLASFGAVMALYHRKRTGGGQHVSTSLAAASVFIQAGDLIEYHARPGRRVGGRDFVGPSAFDRFYKTADGFVRIEAHALDVERLVAAGIDLNKDGTEAHSELQIAAFVAELPTSAAVRCFTEAGVSVASARLASEICIDPDLHRLGLLETRTSEAGHAYTIVGKRAEFSRTPRIRSLFRSGLGQYSRRCAASAGYSEADIEQLVSEGVLIEKPWGDVQFMAPYR